MSAINVFTDGGARRNPGPAAVAFIIYNDRMEKILDKGWGCRGRATNNVAEYTAVREALKTAVSLAKDVVHVHCDSELVVKQLTSKWKIKENSLKKLYNEVKELEKSFESVTYAYLPRGHEKIKKADALVNRALDTNKKL